MQHVPKHNKEVEEENKQNNEQLKSRKEGQTDLASELWKAMKNHKPIQEDHWRIP